MSGDHKKTVSVPAPLKQGNFSNTINVNGVEISWDTSAGTCNFSEIPVAMMWVDSTLAGLMAGVAAMVGPERFNLALQAEGRKSVESDWLLFGDSPDFATGFIRLNLIAKVAGWGDWQLVSCDEDKRECVFRAYNNWEGAYQKALGVCWGSGMLAGKLAGICSKLFGANCWATQTRFVAKGDSCDEFHVAPSERSLEHEIDALLKSDKATRADMAVALHKLQEIESTLRESQQRFDSLVRNIPDGVYVWSFRADGSMGFDYVSPKFCELLGLEEAAIMQDYRLAFAAHPDDLDDLVRANKQAGLDLTPFRWEGRFIVRGETRWIRISSDPTPLPDGRSMWNGVISDITESHAAEQSVRELAADLKATLHAVPDLLFELDAEGCYLKVWAHNPELLAAQENALLGRTVADVLPPAATASVMAAIRETLENGYSSGQTICLELPQGEAWFELSTALKTGHASSAPTVVMLSRDVTGRIRAEGLMRQWSDAFNHAALGIAIGSAVTQKIIAVNPAFAAMLGRAVEEFPDRPIIDNYAPAERDHMRAVIAQATRTGNARYESRFVRKDGSEFPVQVDLAVVSDAGGRLLYRVATVQDITERKQAEALLRESEEKYRLAMDASRDGLWDWDVTTGTVSYSSGWSRILGENAVDNKYEVWESRIHPEDKPHALATLRQHLNGETATWSKEHRLRHANGDWVWVLGRGQVVERDAAGRPLRMVGTMTNIVELKRTEDALRHERDFADNLINTAQAIILVLDMQGRIVRYNSYLENLSGFPLDKMRGKDWMESFIPEHERVRLRALFDSATMGNQTRGNINAILTSTGQERLIEWYDKPLEDTQGNTVGLLAIGHDITERKQLEESLERGKRKLRDIYESVSDCIEVISEEGVILDMNRIGYERLGYTREEMIGRKLSEFSAPEYAARIPERMAQIRREGASTFESARLHKDGSIMPLEVHSRLTEIDGQMVYLGISRDITERKQAEALLRESESRYRRLVENSPDVIYVFSSKRGGIYYSPRAESLLGYPLYYLYAHPFLWNESIHPDDQPAIAKILQEAGGEELFSLEYRLRDAEGNWKWVHDRSMRRVVQDDEELIEGLATDITLLKQHEKQLEHTAHYDALTGIPNRVLLADRMKQALAQARRNGSLLAVCYLDLDGFKPINDSMGHEIGDRVLVETARRIERSIRGGDTVARLGGDEFVILLMGMEREDECRNSLDRLLETISRPIEVGGRRFSLSASIGVTLFPADDEDADTLLRHADQAMYTAKQSGKNRYHLYDPEFDQRTRSQQALLGQISLGLEQGQFELHYQPKIDLGARRLVGAEALIRWRHPERGLLFPGEFLYALEGTELDIALGEWVIARALDQLGQWKKAGLQLELSINISAFHLQAAEFTGKLRRLVADFPELPTGSLQIEILETAALNDMARITAIIEECRSFGVSFALDDFGTGYSSLSYLSNLPVHTLKIDQSFVRDMLQDKGDYAIVQGVIALAHAFERETVAEGIETSEVYQALLEMGCKVGQGYGIARPMPAEELFNWRSDAP